MSNLIEIPEHLLHLFPAEVPLFDADEFGYHNDVLVSLTSTADEVFGSHFRGVIQSTDVSHFVEVELYEEKNRISSERNIGTYETDELWCQRCSEAWCNVMTRLGYTEISDDDR